MPDLKHIPLRCEFDQAKLVVRLDELIPSDTRHIEDAVSRVLGLLEENGCCQDLGMSSLLCKKRS